MRYCKKHNAVCDIQSCGLGETITNVGCHADRYELNPDELNKEQVKQFWNDGTRFFEPKNKIIMINTVNNTYRVSSQIAQIKYCKEMEHDYDK